MNVNNNSYYEPPEAVESPEPPESTFEDERHDRYLDRFEARLWVAEELEENRVAERTGS